SLRRRATPSIFTFLADSIRRPSTGCNGSGSISHDIVTQLHGGTIDVDREVGAYSGGMSGFPNFPRLPTAVGSIKR
ncbi:MAG TPA: hypothetical protein VLA02_06225, partial [Reyranella sp.]|nr:hypothetical protein [Reyranella sp.]